MAMDGVIGHIMVAGEVGVIQSMVAIMVAIHSIQVMGMVIGLVGENKSIISFHKGPGIIAILEIEGHETFAEVAGLETFTPIR